MSWPLLAVLILSGLYLGVARYDFAKGNFWSGGLRKQTAAYLAITTLLLVFTLLMHVAWPGESVRRKALRMEFSGVDVRLPAREGPRTQVRLTGSPISPDAGERRGFRWLSLPEDASIDLRPQFSGDRIVGYGVEGSGMDRPARLNGVAVNRVEGGWVPSGGKATYEIQSGRNKTTLTLEVGNGHIRIDDAKETIRLERHLTLGEALLRSGKGSGTGEVSRDLLRSAVIIRADINDSGSPVGISFGSIGDLQVKASGTAFVKLPAAKPGPRGMRLNVGGQTLVLPQSAEQSAGSATTLRFRFDPPQSYELPPSEVLKETQNAVEISSIVFPAGNAGYVFDTGNPSFPIVKRAVLDPGFKTLDYGTSFGQGDSAKMVFKINEEHAIGDGVVVPVVQLSDPISESAFQWIWPLLGLVLGAGLLAVVGFTGLGHSLGPVSLERMHGVVVLWVSVAAILVTRGVIAYRVSMFPPANMPTVSSENYLGAWPLASQLLSIWLPLLGLLAGVAIRMVEREMPQKLQRRWDRASKTPMRRELALAVADIAFGLAAAIGFLVFFGRLVGFQLLSSGNMLLAIFLIAVGLIFLGLAGAGEEAKEEPKAKALAFWRRHGLLAAGFLVLAADPGAFVYAIPFGLALWVMHRFSRSSGKPNGGTSLSPWTVVIVAALVCLPFLRGPIASIGATMTNAPFFAGKDFAYRFVGGDPDQAFGLLASEETRSTGFQVTSMTNTLHQKWQMDTYIAGSGAGYFKAPLVSRGMTYPTILSDAAFSALLVGEHGRLAGWIVVGFHILIGLCLILAAWDAASSRGYKRNGLALYAMGGLYGFVAVYMALANLWVVPFTGQNVPLLGVGSLRDAFLFMGIAFAGVLIVAYSSGRQSAEDTRALVALGKVRFDWWALPAVLVAWWLILGVFLIGARRDNLAAFNYPASTYEKLERITTEAQRELSGEEAPQTLARTAAFSGSSKLFQRFAGSFDAGSVSQTPITLEPGRSRSLIVDPNVLRLTSPFVVDQGVRWRGSMRAKSAVKQHQLMLAGVTKQLVLRSGSGSSSIAPGVDIRKFEAERFDFETASFDRRNNPRSFVNYGGIQLDKNGRVFLRWSDSNKPARLLVNGARLDLKLSEYELKPLDLVTLRLRDDSAGEDTLALTYLGPTDLLAKSVWRNGRFHRSFPEGATFPLASSIGEVYDKLEDGKGPKQVTLSLDLPLQRNLQNALVTWSASQRRPVDRGSSSEEGQPFTAVTVLDSFSGQILAMAAAPQADPNEDFERVAQRFASESDATTAARSSWALRNRTIGSTIKPLTFAALAAGLNGDGFDIADLSVSESSALVDGRYRRLGDDGTVLPLGIAANRAPRSNVGMFEYLRDSRTWPAVATAAVGLIPEKSQLKSMLRSGSGSTVRYNGQGRSLTFKQATKDLVVRGQTLSSQGLAETVLFKQLEACYGPSVLPFFGKRGAWPDPVLKGYLPSDTTKISESSILRWVFPEPHYTDTTLLTNLDKQLARYLIGAGESRWNTVSMAANGARLATGLKVSPTLSTEKVPEPASMPAPLNSAEWRNAHLFGPLSQITTLVGAPALRSRAEAAGLRIMMKTGTIDDGAGMESELLMFTVGRFQNGAFVPGKTISGYMSIRSSKATEGDDMVKSSLIQRLMPAIMRHLEQR